MEYQFAIVDAISKGDEEAVLFLLRIGASLHKVDEFGRTPLHWTAFTNGGERLVPLLVSHGAHLNTRDGLGQTALHLHCMNGRAYGVGCLLFHGADVNIRTKTTKLTALQIASANKNNELTTILLAYGATAGDV
mmetsp:Transcript_5440/g.5593  ORF Transcript_5440/g.5593 Transcript_5440/m.5593 type:complete len:134 (+) Transcript_5440:310-711(+)